MTKRIICCVLALALLLAVPALAAGSNGLRTSEAGISFIKEHEGFPPPLTRTPSAGP